MWILALTISILLIIFGISIAIFDFPENILGGIVFILLFGFISCKICTNHIDNGKVYWHNNTENDYINTFVIDKNLNDITIRVDYKYSYRFKSSFRAHNKIKDYLFWNMGSAVKDSIDEKFIDYKFSEKELLELKNDIINNGAVDYSYKPEYNIESPIKLTVEIENITMYKEYDRGL